MLTLVQHLLTGSIGESDCELIREGHLAQPVNAWTSVAYAVLGIWVAVRYGRSGDVTGWMSIGFGMVLVLVGAGSVMFHGPQGAGAQWLHDVPIVVAIAFIACWNLAAAGTISWTRSAQLIVLAAVIVGVLAIAVPSTALWAGIPLGIAAVVTEWIVRRGSIVWAPVAIVAIIGGTLNLLGRTSGPLCDPTSLVQLHGLWHVLTAVAFALWVRGAARPRSEHPTPSQPIVSA